MATSALCVKTFSRGKKREVDDIPLPSPVDNEPPHQTKRLKRAETRRCPICDEAVPLRLLAKHAELESERVDEILNKVGSSELPYELNFEPGPSSRTRRSAIKARKSIVTRSTRDSVEQTEKTIQTVKRHRRQRHAKLKEMAKDEDEGNTSRNSRLVGNVMACPVCSATVRGDEDVVDAHVDACLAHESRRQEEVRQTELLHRRAIEDAIRDDYAEDGNYVGDLRGAGFHIRNRNEQDVEEELDIEGDDQAVYGEVQFTEKDVVPVRMAREDGFHVNIEDDSEDEGEVQRVQQAPHDLVSHSATNTEKLIEETGRFPDDLEVDQIDLTIVVARDRGDKEGLLAAMENKIKHLESLREGSKLAPAPLCRICLDSYSEPTVSTGCWHTCCRECWLRSLGSTKLCPICKRITCATNLRRIYL